MSLALFNLKAFNAKIRTTKQEKCEGNKSFVGNGFL